MSHLEEWEPVIGLEIHVQLNTKTKLFSPAINRFGDEPNLNITDVCTGQPGTLPVLNREAVKKALLFGLAVKGEIALVSYFDRKSYFYPDSPRNFQITQFYHPFLRGGKITVEVGEQTKVFSINRAHLEDDAGMLKHFNQFTGVDYNRAGTALIEIVSEPCMHSPQEAIAYAMAVRSMMQYLDISDCNMEEGSLRIDTNISMRKKGEQGLRSKIEIKNLNSFHNMHMALEAEMERQGAIYTAHPDQLAPKAIQPGTYRFDVQTQKTALMRSKESADDYRYFPEPDLPPVFVQPHELQQLQKQIPELPYDRLIRYTTSLALPRASAFFLSHEKALSDYFEKALQAHRSPLAVCNWILVEFAGRLKESGKTLWDVGILPSHIGELVSLIESGQISGKIGKAVADRMIERPGVSPRQIVKENPDFHLVSDSTAIESWVDEVILQNPASVKDYQNGKERAFQFLVGQVMKLCKGKADPLLVQDLLKKKLS